MGWKHFEVLIARSGCPESINRPQGAVVRWMYHCLVGLVAGVRNQRYLQGFVSRIPTISCRFTSATTGRIL